MLLLLLLLSRFTNVRLCETPWTAANQAPPSLGFSRQEYWSGLPFPSPMHARVLCCFSRVRLCVTPWTAANQASPSLGFSRHHGTNSSHFLLCKVQVGITISTLNRTCESSYSLSEVMSKERMEEGGDQTEGEGTEQRRRGKGRRRERERERRDDRGNS